MDAERYFSLFLNRNNKSRGRCITKIGGSMKNYKVIGGYTVYEQYEINVQAKDSKDAIKKAEKIPVEKWDELQNSNDGSGFVIDDVWEDE